MQNRDSMATRQFEAEKIWAENTDGCFQKFSKLIGNSTACVKQVLKNFTLFKTAYKHERRPSNVSGQLTFNKV